MMKYCKGCKRDLEIDNFYSYKKSICKQCVNKKVKCHYCNKEVNSTNLSEHTKQIHSTYNTSNTSDSISKMTNKNNIIDENNEPLYPTVEDGLYFNRYIKLMKDKINILDIKTQDKTNRIPTKNRILIDKIKNNTITEREEKQYEKNLNKLKDLNYFDERVCKILLKYKYLD